MKKIVRAAMLTGSFWAAPMRALAPGTRSLPGG
jgi:hypothetical protein